MVRRPRNLSVRGSSALTALPTCTVWGECRDLHLDAIPTIYCRILPAALFLLEEKNIATHTFSASCPLKAPAALPFKIGIGFKDRIKIPGKV